jgi:hypothetical protein
MKTCRECFLLALTLLFTSFIVGEDSKRKIKNDVCSDSYPASICTANGKSELVSCHHRTSIESHSAIPPPSSVCVHKLNQYLEKGTLV